MTQPNEYQLHLQSPEPLSINTEGVVEVGEIVTRVMREAVVEEDYHNAFVAGGVTALTETLLWVGARLRSAGPYDDTRPLTELNIWLADKIRAVQSSPPKES